MLSLKNFITSSPTQSFGILPTYTVRRISSTFDASVFALSVGYGGKPSAANVGSTVSN